MKKSVFKSEALRDKFRAHYSQVLSQLPFEQRYISTKFGQTFMITAGEDTNPPVILLHGSCSNSAFWFPEIMALSSTYKVYAVDIIGEAGNSEDVRPDVNSDAFALWIKEVLEILRLEKVIMIGNSLGGWVAIKFTTVFPESVSKLCLLASSGLAEIKPQFVENLEMTKQNDENVQVDESIIGEQNMPKEVLDFMNLIIESYNPIPHLPVYQTNNCSS